VITDGDVDDTTAVAHDTDNIRETSPDGTEMVPEMPLPDIREHVEDATPVVANTEDWTRVPDMDTTRDALEVAARALNEMEQRRAWEADREAEDHYKMAGQWQAADQIRADLDSYATVLE
jgi:hypothetical protein